MSDDKESSCGGGILAAFAVGAVIGTGVALLYAPRSGKETRALIARKGRALKGQANDALEDAKDFIGSNKIKLAAALEAGQEALLKEVAKHEQAA